MNELDKQLESLMGADFKQGINKGDREEGEVSLLLDHLNSDKKTNVSDIDSLLSMEEDLIREEALIQTGGVLKPANIKQVEIIEGEEEYDEDDIERELREALESQQVVKDIDLTKELPTLERITHDEYILVTGQYTTLSFDYMKNEKYIPNGEVPIYIEAEGHRLYLRSIRATPDILYNMKYFLVGFEFFLIKDKVKNPLDIYTFLGKLNIEG